MTVVYDAGVLIAADRNDRDTWAQHRARLETGIVPTTTAPVVSQVSRTPRQVQFRRFLAGCDVVAFTAELAHDVGALLASDGTSDVIDAHLVLVAARSGSVVLTSDPRDLRHLAGHLDRPNTVRAI